FMIVLVAAVGAVAFTTTAVAQARSAASSQGAEGPGPVPTVDRPPAWRTLSGWSEAAGYTLGDLRMLRREMVVGFVVAGFLTELVPSHVWSAVFVHGHGIATDLENAAIGPLVAVVSFVCSIGNIPLAAALWKGGISFGGVVSFIFADLIAFPVLLVYRKQYGVRMAIRMLAVFWTVMALAGLGTQILFAALRWTPPGRAASLPGDRIGLDYTTFLNVAALCVLGGLWWLHVAGRRHLVAGRQARDPVCG